MKANQVVPGGRYYAKISGKLSIVRVLMQSPYMRGNVPLYYAVNEATGRRILISPRRLRGAVSQ
jgi:hypothetical protein